MGASTAAAQAAHAGCPSSSMTYGPRGARCTSCGTSWPLQSTSDGKAVGYLLPPVAPSQRRNRIMAGRFD